MLRCVARRRAVRRFSNRFCAVLSLAQGESHGFDFPGCAGGESAVGAVLDLFVLTIPFRSKISTNSEYNLGSFSR